MQSPTEDNAARESCLHYVTQGIGQNQRSASPVSLAHVIHAKLVKSCGLSGKRFLRPFLIAVHYFVSSNRLPALLTSFWQEALQNSSLLCQGA